MVREALAKGDPDRPESFPIAKRVYVGGRCRRRAGPGADERRADPACTGIGWTPSRPPRSPARPDCVSEVSKVAEAGAELILFTALFDQPEQMEQLAAAVLPKLG